MSKPSLKHKLAHSSSELSGYTIIMGNNVWLNWSYPAEELTSQEPGRTIDFNSRGKFNIS